MYLYVYGMGMLMVWVFSMCIDFDLKLNDVSWLKVCILINLYSCIVSLFKSICLLKIRIVINCNFVEWRFKKV